MEDGVGEELLCEPSSIERNVFVIRVMIWCMMFMVRVNVCSCICMDCCSMLSSIEVLLTRWLSGVIVLCCLICLVMGEVISPRMFLSIGLIAT